MVLNNFLLFLINFNKRKEGGHQKVWVAGSWDEWQGRTALSKNDLDNQYLVLTFYLETFYFFSQKLIR